MQRLGLFALALAALAAAAPAAAAPLALNTDTNVTLAVNASEVFTFEVAAAEAHADLLYARVAPCVGLVRWTLARLDESAEGGRVELHSFAPAAVSHGAHAGHAADGDDDDIESVSVAAVHAAAVAAGTYELTVHAAHGAAAEGSVFVTIEGVSAFPFPLLGAGDDSLLTLAEVRRESVLVSWTPPVHAHGGDVTYCAYAMAMHAHEAHHVHGSPCALQHLNASVTTEVCGIATAHHTFDGLTAGGGYHLDVVAVAADGTHRAAYHGKIVTVAAAGALEAGTDLADTTGLRETKVYPLELAADAPDGLWVQVSPCRGAVAWELVLLGEGGANDTVLHHFEQQVVSHGDHAEHAADDDDDDDEADAHAGHKFVTAAHSDDESHEGADDDIESVSLARVADAKAGSYELRVTGAQHATEFEAYASVTGADGWPFPILAHHDGADALSLAVSHDHMVVSWTDAAGADTYCAYFMAGDSHEEHHVHGSPCSHQHDDAAITTTVCNITGNSTRLDGLEDGKTYHVDVVAVSADGAHRTAYHGKLATTAAELLPGGETHDTAGMEETKFYDFTLAAPAEGGMFARVEPCSGVVEWSLVRLDDSTVLASHTTGDPDDFHEDGDGDEHDGDHDEDEDEDEDDDDDSHSDHVGHAHDDHEDEHDHDHDHDGDDDGDMDGEDGLGEYEHDAQAVMVAHVPEADATAGRYRLYVTGLTEAASYSAFLSVSGAAGYPYPLLPADARVHVSSVGRGEVTLRWDPVQGGEEDVSYCVVVEHEDGHAHNSVHGSVCAVESREDEDVNSTHCNVPSGADGYTLSGLGHGQSYHIDVVATGASGKRAAYTSVSVTTATREPDSSTEEPSWQTGLVIGLSVGIAVVIVGLLLWNNRRSGGASSPAKEGTTAMQRLDDEEDDTARSDSGLTNV